MERKWGCHAHHLRSRPILVVLRHNPWWIQWMHDVLGLFGKSMKHIIVLYFFAVLDNEPILVSVADIVFGALDSFLCQELEWVLLSYRLLHLGHSCILPLVQRIFRILLSLSLSSTMGRNGVCRRPNISSLVSTSWELSYCPRLSRMWRRTHWWCLDIVLRRQVAWREDGWLHSCCKAARVKVGCLNGWFLLTCVKHGPISSSLGWSWLWADKFLCLYDRVYLFKLCHWSLLDGDFITQ